MHADMVRHEIQDQPEIVLPQHRAQPLEAGFAAELRIELGVVGDVVAMRAALAGAHEGRRIEMGDAERLQVRHHGSGGVEIEIRRQLQAVGRDRDRWGHFSYPMRQSTVHDGTLSPNSLPQIRVPAGAPGAWLMAWSDRLASRRSVAPSPIRQSAVSRRLSPARASPKAAPASRGTISCRRTFNRSRTSVSRFRAAGASRSFQSSTAESRVDGSSASGTSSPNSA